MRRVVRSPYSFLSVVCFFAVTLVAQDSGGLQARQLYYKSKSDTKPDTPAAEAKKPDVPVKKPEVHKSETPKKTTPPSTADSASHRLKTTPEPVETPGASEPSALGLKYTIEAADSSGRYAAVDPDRTFSTGDAIRVRLEVNSDAYVYLLSRGASGEGSFLFPQPGEDNHLTAFHSVVQPPESADPIRFAEPAGTETLYILVSRTPVRDLDRLLPARDGQGRASNATVMAMNVPSSEFGDLVGHAERMQSRDLVRGKVVPVSSTSSTSSERAVYAVNVSTAPGAQVLQKLELRHR